MSNALAQTLHMHSAGQKTTGPASPENLDALLAGDPAAAQLLYSMYADQIRGYLHRHTGLRNVEDTVFDILLEAVRSIRELDSATTDDLSETVRDLSQQSVFALRRSRATIVKQLEALDADRELVNGVFTVLNQREREILLRSLLLAEQDEEISSELALPVLQIRRARVKARVLFRVSSQFGHEYAAAAPA